MEFYKVIKERRSIREYKPDPIPDDVLKRVLNAARLAPSAKNIQPWRFIVVKDEKLRHILVEACHYQEFIAQAPVIICGVALEKEAYAEMGEYLNSYPVDLAIALDHLILAATNEGLGTCWIGSFNEEKVKRVLGIPEDVRVVALTPLGYPAESPPPRPRKPLSEIVFYNRWKSS